MSDDRKTPVAYEPILYPAHEVGYLPDLDFTDQPRMLACHYRGFFAQAIDELVEARAKILAELCKLYDAHKSFFRWYVRQRIAKGGTVADELGRYYHHQFLARFDELHHNHGLTSGERVRAADEDFRQDPLKYDALCRLSRSSYNLQWEPFALASDHCPSNIARARDMIDVRNAVLRFCGKNNLVDEVPDNAVKPDYWFADWVTGTLRTWAGEERMNRWPELELGVYLGNSALPIRSAPPPPQSSHWPPRPPVDTSEQYYLLRVVDPRIESYLALADLVWLSREAKDLLRKQLRKEAKEDYARTVTHMKNTMRMHESTERHEEIWRDIRWTVKWQILGWSHENIGSGPPTRQKPTARERKRRKSVGRKVKACVDRVLRAMQLRPRASARGPKRVR